MKKLLVMFLALITVLSFVACDSGTEEPKGTDAPADTNASAGTKEGDPTDATSALIDDDEDDEDDEDETPAVADDYNPPDFGEVTMENYNEIMKTYFGLDVSTFEGWTIRYALTDEVNIGAQVPAKEIDLQGRYEEIVPYDSLKAIFDKTMAVSGGTIWAQGAKFGPGVDWVKGNAFTSLEEYAAYFDPDLTPDREGVSAFWVYDYNGHTIFTCVELGSGSTRLRSYFIS